MAGFHTNKDDAPTATDGGNDVVKLSSRDQRLAFPGEPKCIICGRYGEYICDETDDDVCSLDCKQSLLRTIATSPPKMLPASDECFYVRPNNNDHYELRTRSLVKDQADLLRKKLDIHVKGGDDDMPAPILSFTSCHIHDTLLHNIQEAGYDMPTPIQMQAIPAALTPKNNLLVLADTGSGKSASFLIPIVSRCVTRRLAFASDDKKKPLALVLTPTRELCIQVEEHAKLLGKGLPFKTALVVGGYAMAGQLYRIQQGVELIVGTPGRLIDLLMKHEIELDDVMTFVVDEVDCMLQRGFRDQVMQIYTSLSQPQVLMYSATMSNDIEKMTNSLAKGTVVISVGEPNRPNKAVKQIAIWVESKQKKQKLFDILASKQHFKPPVVVYVSSRLGADLLANAITVATGIKASSIHGEKSMTERRETMQSFLVGDIPVVVATGVLSRGVDLLGVRQVIVFDMPNSIKEYVHQIGRASRMGDEGQSIVFVNGENKNVLAELVDVLKSGGAAIPREIANSRYIAGFFSSGKGSKKRKQR
ncbi:putative RNA helicase [Lupinus albus]|uniref:RNA helicase n=1 Tax=Lupinus albus TaxID=3870 RepID=A0A6A4QTR0_LUPAL|nr:putative RNA helicase [Lupinus albus]